MTSATDDPRRNLLFRNLPDDVRHRLRPKLERVDLALGSVLHEQGVRMEHVYFPISAIVSKLYVTRSGASAEIAIVGNDGLVGVALYMGGETTTNRAVVQSAGLAYRLAGHLLKKEFSRSTPVQRLLLRYTQALLTQMAQTAVCNRHHTVRQQLCRWLLMSTDLLSGEELCMTHELIANMLGVRREGVTEAAGRLQALGLIRYRRGRITILDRLGLEAVCCECYEVVKRECERLVPDPGLD
ncbi:Crp/Fnr family transcriptional regulator [Methylonatrum kenyense]|uniref:Crp/Fnr family transcriptional regulator n=1 Tax=Methylonatrum kenyense TaxID=455253 RepID=UPI0020BF4201|nr:Crp/Fnr family transcriptional regulator [Methylonatrum kenyense]MCK8515041.1 Crp/Fnr family transcriptional regulator [Methylonatrum kenyense]